MYKERGAIETDQPYDVTQKMTFIKLAGESKCLYFKDDAQNNFVVLVDCQADSDERYYSWFIRNLGRKLFEGVLIN